jgi:WbqC-like protein family
MPLIETLIGSSDGRPPGRRKRAAILQSAYIPWKGYFDIIGFSDEFILYDDAQYSKESWQNRNRIKGRHGAAWLTIPVVSKGRFGQAIRDVRIADRRWAANHWKRVRQEYARAAHFDRIAPILEDVYLRAAGETRLSRVNELFIRAVSGLLGIASRITRSMDYELKGDRVERLVHLCEQVGAGEYLSGPAARAYLEVERFAGRGIAVRWMDYSNYPSYAQLHPPFVHEVTILDLLFNEGPENARRFLLSTRPVASASP